MIASADVLMLKDGEAITGEFQGADRSTVSFTVNGQTHSYAISDINSITFASAPAQTGEARREPELKRRNEVSDAQEQGSGALSPDPSADMSPAPYSTPKTVGVTVHAGSVITVRMIDPVDSSEDQMGQTYRASLDEPLEVDGQTVVPRGADVSVKLISKEEAGRLTGRSEVSLILTNITVEGRKYEISSSEVTESGSSRGKQTATRAGVGAVIGAAIGALAGGGKGAAIGAATGAGAGTAVQIATHGDRVKIPAETRLDFTLAQPLNL